MFNRSYYYVDLKKVSGEMKISIMAKALGMRFLLATVKSLPLGRRQHYDLLVFKVDRLGDFILSLGVLHLLLDDRSRECALLINESVLPLAKVEFPHASLIPVKFGTGRFLNEVLPAMLRIRFCNLRADQLVCLRYQRIDYHNAMLHMIRCTRSLGYTAKLEIHALNSLSYHFDVEPLVVYGQNDRECRELERHRAIALAFNGCSEISPRSFSLALPSAQSRSGVIIAPFGTNPMRDIPLNILDEVIQQILNITSETITIMAAPSQKERLDELRHFAGPRVKICSDLSLLAYTRFVSSARLVVSAESLTAHLATLYNRYLLCFIGGGHYGEFAPWSKSDRQVWMINHMPCFHCNWHCIYDVPICLHDIDTELVKKNTYTLCKQSGLSE